jgi:hypothetical protein
MIALAEMLQQCLSICRFGCSFYGSSSQDHRPIPFVNCGRLWGDESFSTYWYCQQTRWYNHTVASIQ